MSTTPPSDQPQTTPPPAGGPGPSLTSGPGWGNMPDMARLPIPGNAEFALYVVALVVAMLVTWASDSLNANSWFTFFTVTTAVYILSRGIAKASRVLEQ
jgi:hypothetical protein